MDKFLFGRSTFDIKNKFRKSVKILADFSEVVNLNSSQLFQESNNKILSPALVKK